MLVVPQKMPRKIIIFFLTFKVAQQDKKNVKKTDQPQQPSTRFFFRPFCFYQSKGGIEKSYHDRPDTDPATCAIANCGTAE